MASSWQATPSTGRAPKIVVNDCISLLKVNRTKCYRFFLFFSFFLFVRKGDKDERFNRAFDFRDDGRRGELEHRRSRLLRRSQSTAAGSDPPSIQTPVDFRLHPSNPHRRRRQPDLLHRQPRRTGRQVPRGPSHGSDNLGLRRVRGVQGVREGVRSELAVPGAESEEVLLDRHPGLHERRDQVPQAVCAAWLDEEGLAVQLPVSSRVSEYVPSDDKFQLLIRRF